MGPHLRLTGSSSTAYLRRLRAFTSEGADRSDVVRALAASVLRDAGVEPHDPHGAFAAASDALPAADLLPPPALRTPWLLGQVHESLLDPRSRRRAGAHYTPPDVARGLVAFAREGHGVRRPRVCDPAVGGGAFLLAAAESLARDGADPRAVVRHACFGTDVDPVAVDVARAALALWCGEWPAELDDHIIVADGLLGSGDHAHAEHDLVVGNPPFQSQLGADTARSRAAAESLRARFGDAVVGYVDTAALFLLAATDLVSPGGRVALVQPHSTLVARDAGRVRAELLARTRLVGVWFTTERVFDAGVRVWAPVFERLAASTTTRSTSVAPAVARRTGASFTRAPDAAPPAPNDTTWAPIVADLTGVPNVELRGDRRVGDMATATAGFRDQFYGLVGAVQEDGTSQRGDGALPRLVTAGLVDPLTLAWGDLPVRFAGARWRRPVVDVDRVRDDIARWVRAQLVPKLVVATQTRVLEVAVDERGDVVPSTPVIAVHAPADRLWHLAAALGAPPVSAWALRAALGAALSSDAVKLSARQVLDLPLPADRAAWDDAAALARAVPPVHDPGRRAALERYGAAACVAYGVDPGDVLPWWLGRLPLREA